MLAFAPRQCQWCLPNTVVKISRRAFGVAAPSLVHHDLPVKDGSGDRAISLLEELFPRESVQRLPVRYKTQERHVPRLPLNTEGFFDDFGTDSVFDRRGKSARRKHLENDPQEAILVLLNAGNHLTEADFRRIVPSGKHIEGWVQDGDILKVIPERDLFTMQKTGAYFILFSNPSSAEAYRQHALKLHSLAQSHSPELLVAPIPPPPSMSSEGNDLHFLLQSYALIPPSRDLNLRMVQQPFRPLVHRIIEQEGYDALLKDRRSMHEVLVSPDGFHISLLSLRRMLSRDSKDRGLPWATVGPNHGVRTMDPFSSDASEDEAPGKLSDSDKLALKAPTKFVIAFKDESEARRFVSGWHRKNISSLLDNESLTESYERSMVLDVETIL